MVISVTLVLGELPWLELGEVGGGDGVRVTVSEPGSWLVFGSLLALDISAVSGSWATTGILATGSELAGRWIKLHVHKLLGLD